MDLLGEELDDPWACCFVLDDLGLGLGELHGHVPDGLHGLGDVHLLPDLVEEVELRASTAPDLPDSVVAAGQVLHSQVPGLDHLVELGWALVIPLPPLPLDCVAFLGGGVLLVEG